MKTRQNLHTHSVYCDGKNTLREMAEAAVAAGLTSLGFSSHAWCGPHGLSWTMKPETTDAYFAEAAALKAEFAGRLTLYTGLEVDATLPEFDGRCEYAIGSLHYFPIPGGWGEVDNTPEALSAGIAALGGDAFCMLRGYFDTLTAFALKNRGRFDILGHFDLPAKFNANGRFFDTDSPAYRTLTLDALEAVAASGVIFEVNTGAISRGFCSDPYPARFLLERLRALNAPVLISSDAHFTGALTTHFDETEELLKSVGYTAQMQFNGKTFEEVSLL